MRKPILAANWKMNGNIALVKRFAEYTWYHQSIEIIWGLPSLYLSIASELGLSQLAGQDVSAHESGAHTGEISAKMLKELGCQYVIIGHSERRTDFGEQESLLIQKWQQLKKQELNPIYCIGESLQEYNESTTDMAIARQLESVIAANLIDEHTVIAYEPVWAIGTGNTATPDYAQAVHAKIRHILSDKYANIAPLIRILYGGSVKANNAKDLYHKDDIDGFLVGGASLECEEFQGIIEAIL